MKISIILPVYNESARLERSFKQVYRAASSLDDFEIIIANNGSIDDTEKIGRRLSKLPRVRLISIPEKGRGRVLKLAVNTSRGAVIGYMDIDLAVPLRYLPIAVEKVLQGNDVVIGSRYEGTRMKRTFVRLIASVAYNLMVKLIAGSRINDHQCGFKFWSRNFIKWEVKKVKDNHWFFDTETLLDAQRAHKKIYQLPVFWAEGKSSKVKFSDVGYMARALSGYVWTKGRV